MGVSMEGGEAALWSAPGEVNFAKYRKPELFQRIQALLSVRQTIAAVLGWALLELLLMWLSVPLAFGGRVHWGILTALALYGSVAGIVAGAVLGCARAVNRALEDLLAVLGLTFELTQQAADDLGEIRQGAKALPSMRQLYTHVYQQAVLPTVQAVVLSQSRWLGRPVFWLYRRTLGRLVARFLDRSPGNADAKGLALEQGVAQAEDFAYTASGWIAVTRQRVAGASAVMHRAVMVPLYVAVVMCEIVAVAPLVVAWLVSG